MCKVTLSFPVILQELNTATGIQIAPSGQCEPVESRRIDPEWKPHSKEPSPSEQYICVKGWADDVLCECHKMDSLQLKIILIEPKTQRVRSNINFC